MVAGFVFVAVRVGMKWKDQTTTVPEIPITTPVLSKLLNTTLSSSNGSKGTAASLLQTTNASVGLLRARSPPHAKGQALSATLSAKRQGYGTLHG